jgi:hypothetical protein
MRLFFCIILFINIVLFGQERYVLECNPIAYRMSLFELDSLVGFVEVSNKNDSKLIDEINSSIGNPRGSAYCQALQYYTFWKLGGDNIVPRNGLAQSTFNNARRLGLKTSYTAEVGDLIVWYRVGTSRGHIGRIVEILGDGWVRTIEGNTTTANSKKEGIYYKQRHIHRPMSALMRVKGLVGRR